MKHLINMARFTLINPGAVFMRGDIIFGTLETRKPIRYVATKGEAGDWCLYALHLVPSEPHIPVDESGYVTFEYVKTNGDKLSKDEAAQIINCDDDVKKHYRK